ncbi:MAG TPA: hypothetical protein VJ728_14955 [Candidatus Binataceae bacterium]|nr:hypothetical protein [Candidatus Binataceae bacterium]
MNPTSESQQRAQDFIRWMILRMLYACRPGTASEEIVVRVLQNLDFDYALEDVRQALDYMESAGLAVIRRTVRNGQRARLTKLGVAVVEYSTPAPSGIGRPRRWRCPTK